MLDINRYVYTLLSTNAALLALVGTSDHIFFGFPNSFKLLPIVTFYELNQTTLEYVDNAPIMRDTFMQIEVWTDNSGTTAIAQAVDNVMIAALFDCDFSSDTPEPDTKLRHRVMRYRRQLTAEDIS